MRNRDNKKIRGDIFEEFCVLYLKHICGNQNVWLLKDIPISILEQLKLKRKDMGIDIVVENNGLFQAVQCKYKKHNIIKKNVLSWKTLSTFYAMCLRTGPWNKYIIMTNCDYTRHQGIKTEKDISICLKTLQNITKDNWLKMCNITSNKLEDEIISSFVSRTIFDNSGQENLVTSKIEVSNIDLDQNIKINLDKNLQINLDKDLQIVKNKSKKESKQHKEQPKISNEELRNIRISFFDKK